MYLKVFNIVLGSQSITWLHFCHKQWHTFNIFYCCLLCQSKICKWSRFNLLTNCCRCSAFEFIWRNIEIWIENNTLYNNIYLEKIKNNRLFKMSLCKKLKITLYKNIYLEKIKNNTLCRNVYLEKVVYCYMILETNLPLLIHRVYLIRRNPNVRHV